MVKIISSLVIGLVIHKGCQLRFHIQNMHIWITVGIKWKWEKEIYILSSFAGEASLHCIVSPSHSKSFAFPKNGFESEFINKSVGTTNDINKKSINSQKVNFSLVTINELTIIMNNSWCWSFLWWFISGVWTLFFAAFRQISHFP